MMIAFYILIVLVTVLSVYSAFGTYTNQQEIKFLTDVVCELMDVIRRLKQND